MEQIAPAAAQVGSIESAHEIGQRRLPNPCIRRKSARIQEACPPIIGLTRLDEDDRIFLERYPNRKMLRTAH
jgi:hypothetical protein